MNNQIAKMCAQASLEAYGDCQSIVADECHLVIEGNIECLIKRIDKNIFIAFRGTEDIQDLKLDLDFKKVDEIHQGFLLAYTDIASQVEYELDKILTSHDSRCSIYITGHSLGAAIATLFAYFLDWQYIISGVYLFGSPRVGDSHFAFSYDVHNGDYTFRFINNNDFVCKLPPSWVGYRHVGQAYYYNRHGKHVPTYRGYWSSFWDHLLGRFRGVGDFTPDGLNDHKMKNYLALLASEE